MSDDNQPTGRQRLMAAFKRDIEQQRADLGKRTDPSKLVPMGTEGLHGLALLTACFHNESVKRLSATASDGTPEAEASARTGDLLAQPNVPDVWLPREIQLLVWGQQNAYGPAQFGRVTVNDDTAVLLPQIQAQTGLGRVQILLPEITDGGDRNGQNEKTVAKAQIAADGVPMVRAGQGLFLTALMWTPAGRQSLMDYSAVIPNVWLNDDRVVCGLRFCTFSNEPGIVEQPWPKFLALSSTKLHGISRLAAAFERENKTRKL
jgi:hypothetical protein